MALFEKKDLAGYLAEMIVVVLGILIAFQVEEWRESRKEQQDTRAALVRLKDETRVNFTRCTAAVEFGLQHVGNLEVVLRSLQSGQLVASDRDAFESGLVMLDWLGTPTYQYTTAEEMMATGLLKELEHAELRSLIARMPGSAEWSQRWFLRQRGKTDAAFNELGKLVKFRNIGGFDTLGVAASAMRSSAFEDATTVSYDFEQLAGNAYLVNLVIEATDTKFDNLGINRELCEFFKQIDSQLEKAESRKTDWSSPGAWRTQ